MTAATNPARVNAYHDEHGQAWGVIENAGYERERDTGGLYGSFGEAVKARAKGYDADEVERLHVDIARWDRDGEFWSYDH